MIYLISIQVKFADNSIIGVEKRSSSRTENSAADNPRAEMSASDANVQGTICRHAYV